MTRQGISSIVAVLCFLTAPATAMSVRDSQALGAELVTGGYSGPARLPDFRGRDRAYAIYRTRISEGMKGGPNFAGSLAIIGIGCGAGCADVFVGDVSTGRIDHFPLGGEDNMNLVLNYRRDSRAVVAYWRDLDKDQCMREVLIWRAPAFQRGGAERIGNADTCPIE